MISLATTVFKQAMLGTGTRINLTSDTIKARIGSSATVAFSAPSFSVMTNITKYVGSTDQTATTPTITTSAAGGFDSPSTVVFDCDDMVFPNVPLDTGKTVDWICFYKFVTNDADSIPLWFTSGFTPVTPAGTNITISFSNLTNRIFALPR